MTDEMRPVPGEDTVRDQTGDGVEAGTAPEPAASTSRPRKPNPWLEEGADAPDAADIEDPDEQR